MTVHTIRTLAHISQAPHTSPSTLRVFSSSLLLMFVVVIAGAGAQRMTAPMTSSAKHRGSQTLTSASACR